MRGLRRRRAIGPQAGEAAGGRRVAAELGEQHRADFGIVAQPPAQLRPRRRRGLVPQLRGRHPASLAGWPAVVQRVIASDGAACSSYPERARGDPGPATPSLNVVDVTSSTIEGGRWAIHDVRAAARSAVPESAAY